MIQLRKIYKVITFSFSLVFLGCYTTNPQTTAQSKMIKVPQVPSVIPWGRYHRIFWDSKKSEIFAEYKSYCVAKENVNLLAKFRMQYDKEPYNPAVSVIFASLSIGGALPFLLMYVGTNNDVFLGALVGSLSVGVIAIIPIVVYSLMPKKIIKKEMLTDRTIYMYKEPFPCSEWTPLKNEKILIEKYPNEIEEVSTNDKGSIKIDTRLISSLNALNNFCSKSIQIHVKFKREHVSLIWKPKIANNSSFFLKETKGYESIELTKPQLPALYSRDSLDEQNAYWSPDTREADANHSIDITPDIKQANTKLRNFKSNPFLSKYQKELDTCLMKNHPLFYAIRVYDEKKIKDICINNNNETKKRVGDMTPILFSIYIGQTKATSALVDCGASLEKISEEEENLQKIMTKQKKSIEHAKKLDEWLFK